MANINPHSSRRFVHMLRWTTLLFLLCFLDIIASASTTVSVRKECSPGPPCMSTGGGTITIDPPSAQTVHWTALQDGTTSGRSFFLRRLTPVSDLITLSTVLTVGGVTNGTAVLDPGTYQIAIEQETTGAGTYSVTFNLRASISISLAGHDFGPVIAGSPLSTAVPFTISYTGDAGLSATVTIALTGESDRFTVSPMTGTVSAGSSLTFYVRFLPLPSTAVSVRHNATITITGTATTGPALMPVSGTVSGTSLPNVPDINCPVSCDTATDFGRADGTLPVPETPTFVVPIRNEGNSVLHIESITFFNDRGTAFSYTGPLSTTIPPYGTATDIRVRFAPDNTPADVDYCAHFVIISDDPDLSERTKSCFFQAHGHHRAPRMRVVTSPLPGVVSDPRRLDYGDVEVGFTFHRAIEVFNDGDDDLEVSVDDNCTPPSCAMDPMHNRWMMRDRSTWTIRAGFSHTFDMDYHPTSVSPTPDEIIMRVRGNDPDPVRNIVDVTLRGRGIAPIPIDSVLVLDRSGSMAEVVGRRNKIEALQTAASMYVDLLRPEAGDGIGLVRYNNENDVYLPLAILTATDGVTTHLATALDRLSVPATEDVARIAPRGSTGIGGGMQTGASMFLPATSERRQVMVVLTDGQENEHPYVYEVLPNIIMDHPGLQTYSIGLGRATTTPPEINVMTLQSITNVGHGGYHQVSDSLGGLSSFELESFYFKIFTNAAGVSIVRDPTSSVAVNGAGPIVVDRALIVSSDHSVVFMVVDDPLMREFYQLEMLTPSGLVLTPATTIGGITVHQQRRNNYSIYKVIFPDESLASGYVGEWQLRLTPNGRWNEGSVREALQCSRPVAFSFARTQQNLDTPCLRFQQRPDVINPFAGLVPVGFGAGVSSDYRMDVRVQPSHFLPTADVKLTATLTDRRAPALNGEVFVDVTTPGHSLISGIPLFDDGTHGDDVSSDGTWTTHFIQTIESGSYKFFFRGVGRNERGELAPREDTRYLTLMLPPQTGGSNGGDKGRTPWFSFHLGHSFPAGSFRNEFDSGPSLTLDAEFPVRRYLSIYGMFGYHYFHAKLAGSQNLSVKNLSLNLRAYFPVVSWQGFVQFGPGAYFQNPGSTKFGYNLGAGLDFPVLPNLSIELGADFHHVDPGGINRLFFDPKLGIKFRF